MIGYFWNKYKRTNKDIDNRIRRKFYRAFDILKKMKKQTPEYMEGYFDGANLDEETRKFINFFSKGVEFKLD